MEFGSKEDKENLVLWTCRSCGYDWRGKSPRVRASRPHCSRCGSRNVGVKDWLIDKEKWERARLDALERVNWQCEVGVPPSLVPPIMRDILLSPLVA